MTRTVGWLRSSVGTVHASAARFLGPLTAADESVLAHAIPPVLDIGCGPGRHVLALAERGNITLGIDVTPAAVAVARRRGAAVLERSVFERIPGAGRWATALLLDGNIGIGGVPVTLLARIGELIRDDGTILLETAPPGVTEERDTLCLELEGTAGPWFAWAVVAADELDRVATDAGCAVVEQWCTESRWFGVLRRA